MRCFRAIPLLLAMAQPAMAGSSINVARHFSLFNEICTAALARAEPLKAKIAAPGPFGENVFSVSPGGNLVAFQTGRDDFLIIGNLRYGPGLVMRDCMVQQIVSGALPVETLRAEFGAHRPTGDGVTMTGGAVSEQIPPVGAFAMVGTMPLTDRRDYMFHGALNDGALMSVSFGPGNFRISGHGVAVR